MEKERGPDQYDFMFKTILIGNSGSGKSNILLRFTRDKFNQNHQATVGVQFASKNVQANDKIIKLQIWDTLGQQQYKAIMKTYYKGTSAAILVYDISDAASFKNLDYWYNQIREYSKSQIVIMLVGNKSDLDDQRQVTKQQGFQYAQNKKIAFYEVSAKTGTNVTLIFTKIAQELEKLMSQSENIKKPSPSLQTNIPSKQVSNKSNQQNKLITLKKKSFVEGKNKNKQGGCCPS